MHISASLSLSKYHIKLHPKCIRLHMPKLSPLNRVGHPPLDQSNLIPLGVPQRQRAHYELLLHQQKVGRCDRLTSSLQWPTGYLSVCVYESSQQICIHSVTMAINQIVSAVNRTADNLRRKWS